MHEDKSIGTEDSADNHIPSLQSIGTEDSADNHNPSLQSTTEKHYSLTFLALVAGVQKC